MRFFSFCCTLCFFLLLPKWGYSQWQKINDVDYVWGPFTIYNVALFSETGEYRQGTRPLMLSLRYKKPVNGRDFAISLARSWANLGIELPEQESVIDRLRKSMPNIKKGDSLRFIALADQGYFVLNNQVLEQLFDAEFSQAIISVWLDEQAEIGQALLSQRTQVAEPNAEERAAEQTSTLQGGEKTGDSVNSLEATEQKLQHEKSQEQQELEIWEAVDPVFLKEPPAAWWQQAIRPRLFG